MRRITVFSLVLLVFAAACKPHSAFEVDAEMINNVPDSVIAVEPMIKIMADVHLAEAWVQENKTDTIPQDIRLKAYYQKIFELHGITSTAYQNSYNYYSAHPALMSHIYTKVVEQLNVLESESAKVKKKIPNEQSSK